MDKVKRFLSFNNQVSVAVIDARELINRAIKIHGLKGNAARMLGGLLVCATYLASSLKADNGCVSLTVKAKNGDGAVSVSADAAMHIRGYADGSCEDTLAGGTLSVVREDGYSRPFVGTCEILSDGISDILETYFGQSEQVATAASISVETDENGNCAYALGVVMQLLPDAEQGNILKAGEIFEKFKSRISQSNLSNLEADADKIFDEYFKSFASEEITELFPEYKCNCSEQKIRGVLASLGKAELLKIAEEQGDVRVHCHYCNKDYIYDKKRIEETF